MSKLVCQAITEKLGNLVVPMHSVENSVVDRAITIIGKWGTYINGKSYQQEALVTHNGWQYTTYYDAQRRPFLFFRT